MIAAFDLSGRVAIVTGGARGIGLSIATVLAQAGAQVVITDVAVHEGRAAVDALDLAGLRCEFRELDVSDSSAMNLIVDDVAVTYGRLDIMVNNAAIIDDSSPLTVTEDELDRVHAVNFKGLVFGSQAAARVMIEAKSGSIINVTSGVVDVAIPSVAAYSTSKAAAAQYSRALAVEVAPRGVRVNTIAPGWTDTPMNERHVLRADGSVDPERKHVYVAQRAASAPLGIAGEPVDQAYAVLYLASDASRFVTGAVLRANGGVTMPW